MLCFKACEKLSINPTHRKWDSKGSLVSFVVSLNLHRRHLSASQRAFIAEELTTLDSAGRPSLIAAQAAITQSQAAEMLNVSRDSVQRARKVKESGDKKLIAAVESGETTVSAATQHVNAVSRYAELRNISREKVVIKTSLCCNGYVAVCTEGGNERTANVCNRGGHPVS